MFIIYFVNGKLFGPNWLKRSALLCLQGARIKGLCHLTQIVYVRLCLSFHLEESITIRYIDIIPSTLIQGATARVRSSV